MMKHISNLLLVGLFAFAVVFTVPFVHSVSKSKAEHAELADVKGEILGANQAFILIEFERKIISGCGDATVLGFLTSPDGKTILQLKPIILPTTIAKKSDKTLLYPITDIAGLINVAGDWELTLFVKNNCSILDNQLVELDPMILEVGAAPKTTEKF